MKTNKAFILRNIYGKHILMPIRTNDTSNDPILLNDVAAEIWETALKEIEYEDILADMSKSYELKIESPELIAIKKFIDQMIKMKLLITACEENE